MLGLGTSINRGGFVSADPLLLDTYSGAAAAYSLRKLSSSYSGNCVTVRRDSDNQEANIGFSGGVLDTSALASHCGSANGFAATWFDQSGNSNNANQTNNGKQPKIYDGTTGVVTESGKPALDLDENQVAGECFLLSDLTFTVSDKTLHMVARPRTTNNYFFGILNDSGGSRARFYLRSGAGTNQSSFVVGDPSVTNTVSSTLDQLLYYVDYNGSNYQFNFAVNGGSLNLATGNSSTPNGVKYMIGAINTGTDAAFADSTGLFQEVIIYDSDQSTNRTGIESNINTFYSIF